MSDTNIAFAAIAPDVNAEISRMRPTARTTVSSIVPTRANNAALLRILVEIIRPQFRWQKAAVSPGLPRRFVDFRCLFPSCSRLSVRPSPPHQLPPLSTPNVFSWWRGLREERISLSVLHADVVFDQLSRMCDLEQTTRRFPAIVSVQTRFQKSPKMEIPDKENVYGKRRTP